jgi:hypothetical protein
LELSPKTPIACLFILGAKANGTWGFPPVPQLQIQSFGALCRGPVRGAFNETMVCLIASTAITTAQFDRTFHTLSSTKRTKLPRFSPLFRV